MSRLACIFIVAAMFGAIDLARSEEAPAPPRYAPEPTTGAEADGTHPSYEGRIQPPPYLDGDQRRALLEMARSQDAEQIPTLLKAAQYLEEAGLEDEAVKVRLLAARRRTEWQALFDEKSAELKRLQADVDALRKALGHERQVQIDFKILKISRTKLRQMGFDWSNVVGKPGKQSAKGDAFPEVVEAGGEFFAVLDLLGSRNVAKAIAEPSLTTVDGRKAFVQIGDKEAHDKLMTRVEILPTIAADGSIALDLSLRMRDPHDLGPADGFDFNNNQTPAPTRELQTTASLKPGQTLVVRCEVARKLAAAETQADGRQRVEEVEYLILATPKLVDYAAVAASQPREGKAAEGSQR